MDQLRVVVAAAVILVTLVVLWQKDREVLRPPAHRAVGLLAVLAAALVTAFVAWKVLYPPPAYGSAMLTPSDAGVDIPVGSGASSLIVHGQIGKDGHGQGEGRYEVEATVDGKRVGIWSGKLDQKVQTRKYMRRGVTQIAIVRLEGRHELPVDVAGKTVHVKVLSESGMLEGPLGVEIAPAAPPELPLLICGLLLSFIAGIIDRKARVSKTYLGLGVGVLFAFALLMLEAEHPVQLGHLLRSVPIAFLLGAMGGGLTRGLAMLVVKAPPKTPEPAAAPAAGKEPAKK